MTAVADAVAAPPHTSVPVRHVAAAVVGNALSFYDFLTYSFFSIQIGHAFFPSHDRSVSLLASLAVFGVGFVSRPVGSIVIGRMGDRVGRKPAMVLSFTMLGIAIIGLALTPSYSVIGIAAPVFAIAFRLLQGFALGGEVGPTTAYLLEAAPAHQRGFYTSFQATTQDFAVCCAGFVGVALSHLLDGPTFDTYGWRIAFLIGAMIVPFGFYIRRSMPETHDPLAVAVREDPSERRAYRKVIVLGFLMLASATIATYILSYMTTYATDTLGLPVKLAFWATVVNGGVGLFFDMLGGWLSDRVGRKPVMIVCWALFMLAAVPAFQVMAEYHSASALLWMTALLTVFSAMGSTPIIIALTEGLPARIRCGAVAMTYAFAISIFGGSAQLIVKLLIGVMHSPIAPAWYLAAALAAGLVGMIVIRETAPLRASR
jgi:MHS family citrate/tricarballylate:H+ symporter-like MFS transporter